MRFILCTILFGLIISAYGRKTIHNSVPTEGIGFQSYPEFDKITEYLENLASTNEFVTLESLGTTSERRNITLVKISSGGSDKPIILIDGGMHGRERISVPGVLFVISELLNPLNRHMLTEVDWHLIPVVNPDSYAMVVRTDKLFRKNLQRHDKSRDNNENCIGVDIDRNFDYKWDTVGASTSECSYIYQGPSAFSEVESRAIRDHVLNNKDRIKLYLNFQSYGPYIMYPWRHSVDEIPEDAEKLQELAEDVTDAIFDLEGTNYTVGHAAHVRFPAGGTAADWVKSVGVDYSYVFHFPDHNESFHLKEDLIFPVVKEMFIGMKVFHDHVVETSQNDGVNGASMTWTKITFLSIFGFTSVVFVGLTAYLVVGKPKA